jgi:hypothetical protein
LRININDGPSFQELSKYLWFLPDPFKDFVEEYLQSVYPDIIHPSEAALLSEMFISYITRTCLRVNVQEGIVENSRQIAKEAREAMGVSVDMILNMIMMHVKRSS